MKKVGEHITLDFLGVKQDYSPKFYNKIIYKIAKKAKVEILNVSEHAFKPQGFTLVALLAESHMSFHTFPEKGIVSFDFFTCAKVSPKVALDILKKAWTEDYFSHKGEFYEYPAPEFKYKHPMIKESEDVIDPETNILKKISLVPKPLQKKITTMASCRFT